MPAGNGPDGDWADQGSEDASFRGCIAREQEFLLALIRTLGVAPSDVPDVLQETNLYLVQNQDQYVPDTNFRAWAARVARFRCLNYFRERKRRPMVNLSEQSIDLLTDECVRGFDETNAKLGRLEQCMKALDSGQRSLLAQTYGARLSLKEIAQRERKSHTAVRKTISRIRQLLRDCIEGQRGD